MLEVGFPRREKGANPIASDDRSPTERIIEAGRRLFFAHGFSSVSTDMIAKEARVSKASLYKYFPNMSGVLRAVVDREGDAFETGVPVECDSLEALQDALTQYGTGLLKFLNDPEIIQFTQLMHEEARSHPDVAALFYDTAYGRTHRTLTAMIAHSQSQGVLENALSAEELAEQLIGMWEALRWVKSVMGLTKRPFASPKDWAEKCVATLLSANAIGHQAIRERLSPR